MVSTAASRHYTPKAIESFFSCTELADTEKLVLIDNDQSLGELPHADRLEIVRNSEPRSFAQNLNAAIERAKESNAEVYFLNNDLIFTPGWIGPLIPISDAIITPVSNREFQYVKDGLRCERYLTLEEYLAHPDELAVIAAHHSAIRSGYQSVFTLPFFCVKIPPKVWSTLGPVDESFGKGGAEDNDYCIRAHLHGLKVLYALGAYVLHFSGKSTWHGAETPDETRARDEFYIQRFDSKWGEQVRRLSIQSDLSVLTGSPELIQAFKKSQFATIVRLLSPAAAAQAEAAPS